jgi:UDP-glucose 4-epimerase
VAITGASGIIGGHLAEALVAHGAEVHAFVRRPYGGSRLDALGDVTQHPWDLADEDGGAALLARVVPSVVFHGAVHRSAGSGSVDPSGEEGLEAATVLTARGGARFAKACAQAGVDRFVVLGSSTEYGPRDEPLGEDMADQPVSIHGVTKAALTSAVRDLAGSGLNAVILRIFYAYGEGDNPRRLIPTLCRAALDGSGVRLTPRGFMRDYVHVDDVVAACLRAGALDLEPGEVINVGTGVGTDNHDLLAIVQSLCEGRPELMATDFGARAADTAHWRADTGRMRMRLGLGPPIDLRDGLAGLLEQMRAARGEGAP